MTVHVAGAVKTPGVLALPVGARVIDAVEGARPQTHEHLAILRLLGVERGVVAVTKADAVELEQVELAVAEAAELVPEAEVIAVSAKTGAGLDDLRAALARAAEAAERPERFAATRLWIDRAFSLVREPADDVRVDATVAALVERRFEVEERDGWWVVRRERPSEGATRTLLGRPTPCVISSAREPMS